MTFSTFRYWPHSSTVQFLKKGRLYPRTNSSVDVGFKSGRTTLPVSEAWGRSEIRLPSARRKKAAALCLPSELVPVGGDAQGEGQTFADTDRILEEYRIGPTARVLGRLLRVVPCPEARTLERVYGSGWGG